MLRVSLDKLGYVVIEHVSVGTRARWLEIT